jgi:hypothetical protein
MFVLAVGGSGSGRVAVTVAIDSPTFTMWQWQSTVAVNNGSEVVCQQKKCQ